MSAGLTYEIVTVNRAGASHSHVYSPETELRPGDIVVLGGRFWLISEVEGEKATATTSLGEKWRVSEQAYPHYQGLSTGMVR
jgi:Lhr-like helicase